MRNLTLITLFTTILIISCSKTEDLIAPYHYDVIPKVSNFQLVAVDTTTTGKRQVMMSWQMADTSNLRYFEIFRSQKFPDNFRIIASNYQRFTYADSSLPTFTDSIRLFYLVYPIGTKLDKRTGTQVSFIGPPSDTLIVTVKRK